MRDDRTQAIEREKFIGRIAVLSEYVDRLEKQVRFIGAAPIPMPKLADVRPAILAEGVVAELKRLQAELRICEQDLESAERERDQLRTGRTTVVSDEDSDPPAAEIGFMPEEDDPAVLHQERLFEEPSPAIASAPEEAAVEEPIAPAPPAAPSLGELALQVLLNRGSSASAGFIAGALRAMNVEADTASVEAALREQASAGRAKRVDLGGFVQWAVPR